MKNVSRAILSVAALFGLALGQQAAAQGTMLDLPTNGWQLVAGVSDEFTAATLDASRWTRTPGATLPRYGTASPHESPEYAHRGWGSEYYPDSSDADYDKLLTFRPTDADDPTARGILRLTAKPLAQAEWYRTGQQYADFSNVQRVVRYKSAIIRSKDGNAPQSYGAYLMRARLPLVVDYKAWATFWLWSCSAEMDVLDGAAMAPRGGLASYNAGAIDNIPPTQPIGPDDIGGSDCLRITSYPVPPSAYAPGTDKSSGHTATGVVLPGAVPARTQFDVFFNTYAMIWTPEEVTFFFNGRAFATVPRSQVRTIPTWTAVMASLQMFPAANATAPTATEYAMDIDYIRVYDRRNSNNTPNMPRSSYLLPDQAVDQGVGSPAPNLSGTKQ